jgi:hypothetical protein
MLWEKVDERLQKMSSSYSSELFGNCGDHRKKKQRTLSIDGTSRAIGIDPIGMKLLQNAVHRLGASGI